MCLDCKIAQMLGLPIPKGQYFRPSVRPADSAILVSEMVKRGWRHDEYEIASTGTCVQFVKDGLYNFSDGNSPLYRMRVYTAIKALKSEEHAEFLAALLPGDIIRLQLTLPEVIVMEVYENGWNLLTRPYVNMLVRGVSKPVMGHRLSNSLCTLRAAELWQKIELMDPVLTIEQMINNDGRDRPIYLPPQVRRVRATGTES